MATRTVSYDKKLKIRGQAAGDPLDVEVGIAKVKEMAEVRVDRAYRHGKKRKPVDQTIELVVHLGIDPRQADQAMRGALSLPKGIGKSRRVIAFCESPLDQEALQAGAVAAGGADLVNKITKENWLDFDVAIAHPSMMGQVGKLGRVLGPQGKMPTPKAGTVTPDVVMAVKEFTAGRIEYRNDAGGNIHIPVGKASFSVGDLKENIEAAIAHFARSKPSAAKGQYFKRMCISATHTPSVTLKIAS